MDAQGPVHRDLPDNANSNTRPAHTHDPGIHAVLCKLAGQIHSRPRLIFQIQKRRHHPEDTIHPGKETLVYPILPVNQHPDGTIDSDIDFTVIKFGFNTFLASVTGLLAPYGFTLTDTAMLAPGILSVFVVILLFYLLKELFSDMEPYNYAAAAIGALMLVMNTSFSSKAVATNCDIDAFGMFTMLGAFLLITLAYNRKSIPLAFLAGLGLMFLNMSWTGYSYAVLVLGIIGMVYPIASYINKKAR